MREYKGRDVTWPERCIQCIYVHVPEPKGCEDTSLRTRFLCALRETSCHGKVQETCVWWSLQMLPDTMVGHGLSYGKHSSWQDVRQSERLILIHWLSISYNTYYVSCWIPNSPSLCKLSGKNDYLCARKLFHLWNTFR